MSQGSLNIVCKKILKTFKTNYRTRLERLRGQVYIFDKGLMLSKIDAILDETNLIYTREQRKDIKRKVLAAHDNYIKTNLLNITKEVQETINKILELNRISKTSKRYITYYVRTYGSATRAKRAAARTLSNEIKDYGGSKKSQKIGKALSGAGSRELEVFGVQTGHGQFGAAVSNLKGFRIQQIIEQFKETASEAEKSVISDWESKVTEYLKNFEIIATLDKKMIFDSRGRVKASFTPVISFQDRLGNKIDAKDEGALLADLRKYFNEELSKNAANIEGSDSLITAFKKVTTTAFLSKVKKDKRVKITYNVPKTKEVKTNSKSKEQKIKVNKKISLSNTKSSVIDKKDITITRKKQEQPTLNLNALKAQINARLSMTVIKNMGTPALENRTGRFARSVQVTDVTQTSQGFASIGYDYQKYPYQTFEPGYAQGSSQRDPRKVIDRSIREIAQELIVGRFYTRRV